MKAFIIFVLLVLLMVAIGWLSFRSTGDRATISLETKKIEQDTKHALREGREALQGAGRSIDRAADESPKR
jgi:hypothetical protein